MNPGGCALRAAVRASKSERAMTKLRFTKMHGLGNDFVVLDGIAPDASTSPRRSSARLPTGASASAATRCSSSSGRRVPTSTSATGSSTPTAARSSSAATARAASSCSCATTGYTTSARSASRRRAASSCRELVDDGEVTVDMGVPRFAPADVPFVGGTGAVGAAARRRRRRRSQITRRVDGQSARGAGRGRRRRRAGRRRRVRASSTTRAFRSA